MSQPTKSRKRRVLLLRTCNEDMTSYGGFQWPRSGPVEAPDWNPEAVFGGGLHGLLWGEGHPGYLKQNAVWVVFSALESEVVHGEGELLDTAKARRGFVEHSGDRDSAIKYLLTHGAAGKAVVYASLTGGDRSTLIGGDRSTLTGGYCSTLTGGYCSTLTGGDGSIFFCRWWSGKRWEGRTAFVGEGGLKAGVPYRVNSAGKWEAV